MKLEFFSNDLDTIRSYFGCIESVEFIFDIEYSCGDGLFYSDIENDDILSSQYDGKLDVNTFRVVETKKTYSKPKLLTCWYNPEEQRGLYINNIFKYKI